MWYARQLQLALTFGLPAAVCALAGLASASGGLLIAAGCLIALGAASTMLEYGRYRSWAFAERHDDLLVRRGLLVRRLSVVPYGRMQFIDVSAGPIDRLFGLATVQLHTAAAASDARIPGLPQRLAELLRDRLAAAGEAQATGL